MRPGHVPRGRLRDGSREQGHQTNDPSREGGDMIKSKRVLAAALVAALGLTAAACGDDDDEATPETAAPGDTSAATTPEGTTHRGHRGPGRAPRPDGTDAPDGHDAGARRRRHRSACCSTSPVAATSRSTTPPPPVSTRPRPTSASSPGVDADRRRQRPRRAHQALVGDGNQLVIGVGFLWGDAIDGRRRRQPRHALRHRRLASDRPARPTTD